MEELIFADGINSNIPKLMIKSDSMSDFLYPIFLTTHPDGAPNIRKAEKVAVNTRYDIPLLKEKVSSKMGIIIPFIPTPNPIMKKAIPVMIKGNRNFVFICGMILLLLTSLRLISPSVL